MVNEVRFDEVKEADAIEYLESHKQLSNDAMKYSHKNNLITNMLIKFGY